MQNAIEETRRFMKYFCTWVSESLYFHYSTSTEKKCQFLRDVLLSNTVSINATHRYNLQPQRIYILGTKSHKTI